MTIVEHERLATDPGGWRRWGPYLAERAWGTVREDYSPGGAAWDDLPHDHARSRAYRWNEDGLGGICDDGQRLCLAFAFWNGVDPILKERIFGLTGNEGNHGEDAKEHWWFLDSTPTHSWMRWRYWYPQGEFPYGDLVDENRRRGRLDPEYELLDTGIFDDDRYWDITVDYAKADADDLCIRLTVRNAGPDEATLARAADAVVPQHVVVGHRRPPKPSIVVKDGALVAEHHALGRMVLAGDGRPPRRRLRERDQPAAPVGRRRHHAVPQGRHQRPRGPRRRHRQRRRRRHQGRPLVRPRRAGGRDRRGPPAPGPRRRRPRTVVHPHARPPASARPTRSTPTCSAGSTTEAPMIARQAFAGMMWTKQWYHYDVERWLDGDPAGPPPPGPAARAQPRVAAPEQRRRDHRLRHVGVPVVRDVGPRLPLRGHRPRRRRRSPRTSCC